MQLNEDDTLKLFVHQMNSQAKGLNKDIIQKSATMQDIPIDNSIYEKPKPKHHAPPPQPIPQQVYQQLVAPPPQITGDPALLNNLIERVSSVEKQITKFVNLIERRVAKNAKEINIRIKLDNDSTDKE
jgi:hypothetical protein